jgi:hypothetical protein
LPRSKNRPHHEPSRASCSDAPAPIRRKTQPLRRRARAPTFPPCFQDCSDMERSTPSCCATR